MSDGKKALLAAQDVAIAYKQGDFKDIGLKEWVTRHLTKSFQVEQFMAVDGVSFTLERGELLGIVGTNGAGKSTLLKAVAGIMEPKRGAITRNGRISALLELGSGFDGELTVKENAYLRGAMLGYTEAFMHETYGQIIAFAELEKYENRPFKQLSTGMQSRLAFSIASLVEPEILILDEVLSVGDGAFQQKSAEKMRSIIQSGAATILVSHSLSQIRQLSTKVLWLHHGRQIALGDTQSVCDRYAAFLAGDEGALEDGWLPPAQREESGRVRVSEVWVQNANGEHQEALRAGESWELCLRCTAEEGAQGAFGYAILAPDGTVVTGSDTALEPIPALEGSGVLRVRFASLPLAPGRYTILAAGREGTQFPREACRKMGEFEVYGERQLPGLVDIGHSWRWEEDGREA